MAILADIALAAKIITVLISVFEDLFPPKSGAAKKASVMAAVNNAVAVENQAAVATVASALIDNAVAAVNAAKQPAPVGDQE
ncbi:MAG: hypothetical protein ACLQSX_11155 [Smithella sp.]